MIAVERYQISGEVKASRSVFCFFVVKYNSIVVSIRKIIFIIFNVYIESDIFVNMLWKYAYVQVWLHLMLVNGVSSVMNLELTTYSSLSL